MKNALDKAVSNAKKSHAAELDNLKAAMQAGAAAIHKKDVFSASLRVVQIHRRAAAKQHAVENLLNCHHIVEKHNQKQNVT